MFLITTLIPLLVIFRQQSNTGIIRVLNVLNVRYSVIIFQSAKMRETIIVVFRTSVFRFRHLNINMVIKEMSKNCILHDYNRIDNSVTYIMTRESS